MEQVDLESLGSQGRIISGYGGGAEKLCSLQTSPMNFVLSPSA
jgi:hypothetical protein